MSHNYFSHKGFHQACSFKYVDTDSIHTDKEVPIEFSPWKPSEALTDWWKRHVQHHCSISDIERLVDGIEQVDKAESERAYRRSILLLYRDCKQWLLSQNHEQISHRPIIQALCNNLKLCLASICVEMRKKANETITYAELNMSRYTHDIHLLENQLKHLPKDALESEKKRIQKRIDTIQKPLSFLQHLKSDSEENITEIVRILA